MELEGVSKTTLLYGAAAAVGLVLFALRRPATQDETAGPDAEERESIRQQALELADLQTGAAREIRLLQETNAGQQRLRELDLLQQSWTAPAPNRLCYSVTQWAFLPADVQRAIRRQVNQGSALVAARGDGSVCVTPTTRGLAGHQPITTYESSRGLLGSTSRSRGAGGQVSPPTSETDGGSVIGDILDSAGRVIETVRGGRRRR